MNKRIALLATLLATTLVLSAPAHAMPDCYDNSDRTCHETDAVKLPASVDEFLALRDKIGKDPWGGASLFLIAWAVRADNPSLGDQMLVLALHEGRLVKGGKGIYKGYSWGGGDAYHMNNLNKSYPWCRTAYPVGTTDEAYAFDKRAVKFRFRKQERLVGSIESGKYKVFACSAGTATCRPMQMLRNEKGFWKVDNFSSLSTGCAKPKTTGPSAADDL
jgi:hypothetical protein